MYSKAFHSGRAITTQGASLDEVVLANMLVLEVSTHRNLSLESAVANRAMVRQAFRVRRKMFRQVILSEEPFLANATFVGLHARVSHLVATHVRAIGKLHVAHVTLKEFSVRSCVGILSGCYVVIVGRALGHVCGEGAAANCTEAVASGTFEQCATPFRSFFARCGSLELNIVLNFS